MTRIKHSNAVRKEPRKSTVSRKTTPPTHQYKKIEKKHKMEVRERKPHRFKPGTVALRDIKKYQKDGSLLVRRAPFNRLIRRIASEESDGGVRFTPSARRMIQELVEADITEYFTKANWVTIFAKHVTVTDKALEMIEAIMEEK